MGIVEEFYNPEEMLEEFQKYGNRVEQIEADFLDPNSPAAVMKKAV